MALGQILMRPFLRAVAEHSRVQREGAERETDRYRGHGSDWYGDEREDDAAVVLRKEHDVPQASFVLRPQTRASGYSHRG